MLVRVMARATSSQIPEGTTIATDEITYSRVTILVCITFLLNITLHQVISTQASQWLSKSANPVACENGEEGNKGKERILTEEARGTRRRMQ